MKQVWILIISIMILVTAGICEIKFLNNSSKYLKADLDYIENAVLNNNTFCECKGKGVAIYNKGNTILNNSIILRLFIEKLWS